ETKMLEIDLWALAELDTVIRKVREAYDAYEFHTVYHALYNFCTVTLSARYFDIIKDRLYTFAPRNQARRSAQTALYRIADALARLLAPILAFTSDEIWENLPANAESRPASVHIATFPDALPAADQRFAKWEQLFAVREDVLRALEEARIAKHIGSSLEARVEISAAGATFDLLEHYRDELRYLFIVSQVEVTQADTGRADVTIKILAAEGNKCERCWNYSTRVGDSTQFPTVCERCLSALEEIEAEGLAR
ncbi:MAG TPA: class I tRNA ligase family protein, partial [Pyrinomonadaceae bacterium]|nr:class I tRNA ligase family protein [Pyrinomonadaceae bacterium]